MSALIHNKDVCGDLVMLSLIFIILLFYLFLTGSRAQGLMRNWGFKLKNVCIYMYICVCTNLHDVYQVWVPNLENKDNKE